MSSAGASAAAIVKETGRLHVVRVPVTLIARTQTRYVPEDSAVVGVNEFVRMSFLFRMAMPTPSLCSVNSYRVAPVTDFQLNVGIRLETVPVGVKISV